MTAGDDGAISVQATFKTAGSRTLTATDTASPSITGTSGPVSVGAADATSLTVTAPGTATGWPAVTATVTAIDAFGNTAAGYRGTVGFLELRRVRDDAGRPRVHRRRRRFSADVTFAGPPATSTVSPTGFGFGLGNVIVVANVVLLLEYTISCHSCRHIVAGKINSFSKHPGTAPRHGSRCQRLNGRHMELAWITIGSLIVTDAYIGLVAAGVITDLRFVG